MAIRLNPDITRQLGRLIAVTAVSAALSDAIPAQAAGFETAPIGARDGGRAGASVVGADSALGMFYNPATILAAPGLVDAALALHGHVGSLCFTRTTVNEDENGQRSAGEREPKVCAGHGLAILPEVATSMRFGSKQRFAIALGVSVPLPRGRKFNFGDPKDGTIASGTGRVPSPGRYLLMDENVIQVFPTLGAAYEPHRQIRVGASFGWGVTSFDFTQATFARVVVLQPDVAGATADVSVRTSGRDAFTPRVQLGTVVQPVAHFPLTLGLSFSYTGDVNLDHGKARIRSLSTDYYANNPLIAGVLANAAKPNISADLTPVRVNIPQTSSLAGGLRYAHALPEPADKVGDRLSKERFDVEFDSVLTFSKHVDEFTADLPPSTITVPSPSPLVSDVRLALPRKLLLPQRWKNQVSLRFGGDYSVLPGRVSVRAGVQYETSGVRHGYEQLDFLPTQQWGLALGATLRIIAALDVSLAYSHFIIPTHHVSVGSAQLTRQLSGDARTSDAQVVNAGSFSQRLDAVALELTTRF